MCAPCRSAKSGLHDVEGAQAGEMGRRGGAGGPAHGAGGGAGSTPSARRRWGCGTPSCRTNCRPPRSTRPTAQYLAAEQKILDEVRTQVTDKLPPEAQDDGNRYFAGAPIYPQVRHRLEPFLHHEPDGPPVGAVVLLHGLTDSPYSLRHIAKRYRDDGYVAVAIRLPGHGSVPSGLTAVEWAQWTAATRYLAVREARRRAGGSLPLHVVGFSNGGALAMKYALEALSDIKALARPDRIILVSPMIGITSLARFAGVFGWPAVFPAFAKAAWLGIVPEFNLQVQLVPGQRGAPVVADRARAAGADLGLCGRRVLKEIAPVLTFQSVVDFTVSTRAIVNVLYVNLPQRQRTGAVRHQPQHQVRPLAAGQHRHRGGAPAAARAADVSHDPDHQREPWQRRGAGASPKPARRPSRRATSACCTRATCSRCRTWRCRSR